MNRVVGSHNILFITLDTLRYDIAERELNRGNLPGIGQHLPGGKWEMRHAPGSFTFSSHQAFFAGFLPTPVEPRPHGRLFAIEFPGSRTTTTDTFVFRQPSIVQGFAANGYRTICMGGVGFFNTTSVLGSVLPAMFEESYWESDFGVAHPESLTNQVDRAIDLIQAEDSNRRMFLFLNVAAIHQPNYFYISGRTREEGDDLESHAAALRYVDGELPRLWDAFAKRGPLFVILCSDHGTAYGEDGYTGHNLAHPVTWTVPYGDFFL